MRSFSCLLSTVFAAALATGSVPAMAQMHMGSMTMPMPANQPAKETAAKKPTAKKSVTKKGTSKKTVSKRKAAPGHRRKTRGMIMPKDSSMSRRRQTRASSGSPMQMPMAQSQMQRGPMAMPSQPSSEGMTNMPMPSQPATGGAMPMPMDQQQMGKMPMQGMQHGMAMKAALGGYPEQRESSGTAWQPDASSAMGGPMVMSGDWMLMAHGTVNVVDDHQSGARGDDKAFVSGMLMGMAQHPLGNGTLQFRTMLSPDPLMGRSGYPLLLASGETANGRDRLIDRQHPHDFFMELSAAASQRIGSNGSVFLYAGLPGEPAFGPPTFMHRESIEDSPEAPITHHWLDSTHITFGVVTAGLVVDRFKVEASRFNGREPDQHRWNIETGPLDSSSMRVSWNPTRTLALQGSWAHLVDPEQLEPGVNQTRWSASALWAEDTASGWHAAATLAWGRKSSLGHNDEGYAAEASLKHDGWTLFGRGEVVDNRELIQGRDEPAYRVGKVSLGAVRDFQIADHLSLGAGGLFSLNFVPGALTPLYDSHSPTGAMGFVRLKLD
jgi:hypothetical protein